MRNKNKDFQKNKSIENYEKHLLNQIAYEQSELEKLHSQKHPNEHREVCQKISFYTQAHQHLRNFVLK